MPKSMNETSPGWGTVLKLIGQGIAAGSRAQNLVFRAIGLDRERDCPAVNNLFVKEFQGGPWVPSHLFQNRFRLSFQFRVNTALGDCAHVPMWPKGGLLSMAQGKRTVR